MAGLVGHQQSTGDLDHRAAAVVVAGLQQVTALARRLG